jgi:fatty acid desaturase
MEENVKLVESLLEKAEDFGKTSYEVIKLKVIDKTSDVISSFVPHSIVFVLVVSFLLFLNLGLAFWLGEILGKIYYGFFIVTAFYAVLAIVMHFLMHKWIKRLIWNSIIKLLLN